MELNPFQEGCYLRLIDHYMDTRQPIPDSDIALARIIGISVEQWLSDAEGILRPFFIPKKGLLYHDRCDKILTEQDEKAKTRSEKSRKGATARWHKNNDIDATGIPHALPADATGKEKTGQSSTPVEDSPLPPKPKGDSHARPRRKPGTFIPEDFGPDIGCLALAGELGIDVESTCREFIDYWKGRGEARAEVDPGNWTGS